MTMSVAYCESVPCIPLEIEGRFMTCLYHNCNHLYKATMISQLCTCFLRNNVGDPVISMIRKIILTFPDMTCIFLNCDLVTEYCCLWLFDFD